MNSELIKRNYVLCPIQKQGWNLQVGTLTPEGQLLYVGKSENLLSLRHGYDLSVYDLEGQLLVRGEQRKGKPSYLFRFVLTRDGDDVCSIQQPRLFTRTLLFSFSDGDQCAFWGPMFSATYRGESPSGWRYEAKTTGNRWDVSIWGLEDDITLLSALTYCFRNDYMNQFS
jgi:hypothetical protein